jgi:tetratricopeptide (TPR) repeat protein
MLELRRWWLACAVASLPCVSAPAVRADEDPDTEVARRLFDQGRALYLAGDYAQALKAFEEARIARPSPAFDFNIARCHDRLGSWTAALAEYERFAATAKDPDDLKEARERIEVLRERVKMAANRSTAEEHYRNAITAYNGGDHRRAIEEFKLAHAAVPDPLYLYNIAQAYRLMNAAADAVKYYQSFLAAAPDTPLRTSVQSRIDELKPALAASGGAAPVAAKGGAAPTANASSKPVAAAPPPAARPGNGAPSQRLASVAEVIKAHRAGFRACYDAWSAKNPGVPGKVALSFYLDPDGILNQASADSTSFSSSEVTSCIVAHARTLTYPAAPNGKYTRYNYPFDFKPN